MLPEIFDYQGQQVRTVILNNEPWFVAKDVCEVLELGDVSKACSRLDDDEKGTISIPTRGGNQEMLCVNEPGLYSLILGSRKPEAKQFKRWITHEVIPTIRKTGGYVANENLFIETYLPHADEHTKSMFKAMLETVRKANETITILKPKGMYFDALVDRNLLTNFRDTAKELKIKETQFIKWLLEKKYVYRDQGGKLKPYAEYVPDLFEMKEWENKKKSGTQTMITPRGRETFRLLIQESGVSV